MGALTCRELIGFLGEHHDGALAAPERARFDAHLAGCPECRAYLRTYADAIRLGKAAFDDVDRPVPADVPDDLVRAILDARRRG